MKLAIDITETCSADKTGCAHYTRGAAEALGDVAQPSDRFDYYCRLSRWRQREHLWHPSGKKVHWYQEPVYPFWPNVDCALGFGSRVPGWRRSAKAAVLFDVFSALDASEAWSSQRFRERKRQRYAELAKTCDVILAISECTRRDFLTHYAYPPERVRVIHGGIDERFSPDNADRASALLARYNLPKDFVLYVGHLCVRKNTVRMIQGFAQSHGASHHALVLAGNADVRPEITEAIINSGVQDKVHFLGYVPDDDIAVLHAAAKAFVFPTMYEGLGLPILEAMASGTPTVIGHAGAAPEIAGGHATIVDPLDPDDIARGIDAALAFDDRQIAQAQTYASTFTWQQCATKIRDACIWAVEHRR